jgi:polynucleotide 5'-kinase involved in rRNA processing
MTKVPIQRECQWKVSGRRDIGVLLGIEDVSGNVLGLLVLDRKDKVNNIISVLKEARDSIWPGR